MRLSRQAHTKLFNRRSLGYLMMGIAAAQGAHAQTGGTAAHVSASAQASAEADANMDSRSIVDVLQANRDSLVRASIETAADFQGNIERLSESRAVATVVTANGLDVEAAANSAANVAAIVDTSEGASVNLDAATESVSAIDLDVNTDLVQASQQELEVFAGNNVEAAASGTETMVSAIADGVSETTTALENSIDASSELDLSAEVIASQAISARSDEQTQAVLESSVHNALEVSGVAGL